MKMHKSFVISIFLGLVISLVVGGCGKEGSGSSSQPSTKTVEQEIPASLTMIEYSVVRNQAGKIVVKGNAKNVSNQKISHATAQFKLLDSNGHETGETFASVDNLEVQFTWAFEASVTNESTVTAKFIGFVVK